MATDLPSELDAFGRFVTEQIDQGHSNLSPEECLDLWRAENPSPQELNESTAVLTRAIADMAAGDCGGPAHDAIDELRRKHGLTRS